MLYIISIFIFYKASTTGDHRTIREKENRHLRLKYLIYAYEYGSPYSSDYFKIYLIRKIFDIVENKTNMVSNRANAEVTNDVVNVYRVLALFKKVLTTWTPAISP